MPSSLQVVPVVSLFDYFTANGLPVQNARITVVLNSTFPATSISPVTTLSRTQWFTTTDANGYWQFLLPSNLNIAPANTTYTVSTPDGSYDVTLGSTGPYQSTAPGTIVNVPTPLAPVTAGTVQVGGLLVTAGEPGIDTIAPGALLLGDNTATSVEFGPIPVMGRKYTTAPSGGDDGPAINALIALTPTNGTIEFQPGSYLINTSLIPKSGQTYYAARGSVTLRRTVIGDIFQKAGASAGTLTNVTWDGLTFDCTGVGWSAINIAGSDAAGQLSNITLKNCNFVNPSSTWMIQLIYVIVDPTIPVSKNTVLRIEDCKDDATGQTFSLENLIISNWEDVLVSGCTFLNAPASLASHVSLYAYNRNVRFTKNYTKNWLSARALYIQQSDSIVVEGDQYRTTTDTSMITVFNSKDVSILGCTGTLPSAGAGYHVGIVDHASGAFDGHTALYTSSTNVRVQDGRWDGGAYAVNLDVTNLQGQTDIFVEGNMVSPFRSLFILQNVPNAPSGTIKRLYIQGNHVISHSGFSGGVACVEIHGNATAALGGVQTVVIADNFFPASGGGGSGTDIEVLTLADDVTIKDNKHTGSATPIVVTAAVTNLRVFNNPGYNPGIGGVGIVACPGPLNGQTAAVASVAAAPAINDGVTHLHRVGGAVTITTLGSGSINLQVVYTDQSFTLRTCNIPLCATAGGVFVAAAVTADDYKGSVILRTWPNTTVTLKTAGTFTGCTYDVSGLIEQIA